MGEWNGEHGQVADAGRGGQGEETRTVGCVIRTSAEMGHGGGGQDGDRAGSKPFLGALDETVAIHEKLGTVRSRDLLSCFKALSDGFAERVGSGQIRIPMDIPGFSGLKRCEQGQGIVPAGMGLMRDPPSAMDEQEVKFGPGPKDGGLAAFGEGAFDPEQGWRMIRGEGFDGDFLQGAGDQADFTDMALDPAEGIEGGCEWSDTGVVGEPAWGAEGSESAEGGGNPQ